MADILRIKRRAAGGAAGPPASLAAAELAFNEQDNTLYYGKGNSAGAATSILPIAGPGGFLPLTGGTVTGATTFSAAGTAVAVTNTIAAGGLNVNGGFVIGGVPPAGVGGTIAVTGSTTPGPLLLNDGINTALITPPGNVVQLWIASSANARILMDGFATQPQIEFRRVDGSQSAPAALAAAAIMGAVTFNGYDGTTYPPAAASWQVSASGAWTATNHATLQQFFTTPLNTTTLTEQMRISGRGNLQLFTSAVVADDAVNLLQCNGNVKTTAFFSEGITTGITLTGTTQATALALTTGLNILASVPAGSGAVLPQGNVTVTPGTFVDIFNTTTVAAKVYGTGIATIDGIAAATGVTLSGGNRCRYFMTANGTWVSALMGGVSA